MNTETLSQVISIIGEDRVEKAYDLIGGERISFAVLYRHILSDRIKEKINAGHSFRQIAKEYYISRMTVYRVFRRSRKK